mmetsp:Transcript_27928/g.26967  ORF Transcript_27928/g.26967 Transcript_27928/m.26967 type:complete len:273 (+) Transcript_27928:2794-3612(+)
MFNEKASDMDRQKRLEDLIRKDYEEDDENEDNEIPNDDQVNLLIKRDDEEYEMFARMDQERYLQEGREEKLEEILEKSKRQLNLNNVNYRLMQEWEVPYWVKQKPENPDKLALEYGLGKRQRKQVNYNDEMSDRQWLSMIESGVEEGDKKKKKKQASKEDSDTMSKGRRLDPEKNWEEEYGYEEEEEKVEVVVDENQEVRLSISKNLDPSFHKISEQSLESAKKRRKLDKEESSLVVSKMVEEEEGEEQDREGDGDRKDHEVFCGVVNEEQK